MGELTDVTGEVGEVGEVVEVGQAVDCHKVLPLASVAGVWIYVVRYVDFFGFAII